MENRIRSQPPFITCLIACLLSTAWTSCTILEKWRLPKKPTPKRSVAASVVPQDREPVWIKPVLGRAWVGPHTNSKGDFIGGHYVATIVEQGRWSTEEEAELLGRDFLRTQDSLPILPEPLSDPLPPSLQSLPPASIASLRNQIPVDSKPSATGQIPSAEFYPRSNRIVVTDLPDPSGCYSVETPKGTVLLKRQGNDLLVEFDGRTRRTSIGKERPIEISLDAS